MKKTHEIKAKEFIDYVVTNCTAILYGEKISGVLVHEKNDIYCNRDGVLFDYSIDDFDNDIDVAIALTISHFETDSEVLDAIEC